VAPTEAGDRGVIRTLIGRNHPEPDVLDTATLDPAARLLPYAVRIQSQGHHHRRGVGRRPSAVVAIGLVEPGQIELVHHVDDEPRQVIPRQSLGHARRHQELLIAIDRTEVERHGHDDDDIQARTRAPNGRSMQQPLAHCTRRTNQRPPTTLGRVEIP
jgi:hypothetical protein